MAIKSKKIDSVTLEKYLKRDKELIILELFEKVEDLFLAKQEIRELQEQINLLKKSSKTISVHNERGAGRKLKADLGKVTKIITANLEKTLREIKIILDEQGEEVSLMTISRIKAKLKK